MENGWKHISGYDSSLKTGWKIRYSVLQQTKYFLAINGWWLEVSVWCWRACVPYPYGDKSLTKEEELVLFRGDSFSNDHQQFVFNGIFNFVPTKDYNGRTDKNQQSDPFGFKFDIKHRGYWSKTWDVIRDLIRMRWLWIYQLLSD